jgi:hypothetical protein
MTEGLKVKLPGTEQHSAQNEPNEAVR